MVASSSGGETVGAASAAAAGLESPGLLPPGEGGRGGGQGLLDLGEDA